MVRVPVTFEQRATEPGPNAKETPAPREDPEPERLTGTLSQAQERSVLTMATRQRARPARRARPVGSGVAWPAGCSRWGRASSARSFRATECMR